MVVVATLCLSRIAFISQMLGTLLDAGGKIELLFSSGIADGHSMSAVGAPAICVRDSVLIDSQTFDGVMPCLSPLPAVLNF